MSARQPDMLAIETIRQDLEAAENANDPDALAVHLADDEARQRAGCQQDEYDGDVRLSGSVGWNSRVEPLPQDPS